MAWSHDLHRVDAFADGWPDRLPHRGSLSLQAVHIREELRTRPGIEGSATQRAVKRAVQQDPQSHPYLRGTINPQTMQVKRPDSSLPYLIDGWPYRLMARRPEGLKGAPNKGSAYNSCLATSACPGVDGVVLLSRGRVVMFEEGREFDFFEV